MEGNGGTTADDGAALDMENLLADESLAKLVPELVNDASSRESLFRLRDMQKEHDDIFAEYIREKLSLENKFERLFTPLFVRRQEEIESSSINDFWSRSFENCPLLRENITERDAIALRYLADVSCETVTVPSKESCNAPSKTSSIEPATVGNGVCVGCCVESKEPLPPGSFVLKFRFRDNPFFENDILIKTYIMASDDHEDLVEARGCKILWKKGMELTVRTLKKKGKNGRVFIKKQTADSFFNFFTPPKGLGDDLTDKDPSLVEELEDVMDADFELGECIRSEVIPRALLYFLDIAVPDDEDDDDEDDDDDDSDDEDDDDEGDDVDDDESRKKANSSRGRSGGSGMKSRGKEARKNIQPHKSAGAPKKSH